MSKIVVQGFLDLTTQAWAHTSHYFDLYLSFFKETVGEEKKKASDSLLLEEFGQIYAGWALEEVYKLGLVTVYHHWEKCIKKLLREQSAAQGLRLLTNNSRVSFVEHVKRNLVEVFNCNVDETIWDKLNETREIVNCYKHGSSDKFQRLYESYPVYFTSMNIEDDVDYSDHFLLGEEGLDRLGKNILNFWETLPKETKCG